MLRPITTTIAAALLFATTTAAHAAPPPQIVDVDVQAVEENGRRIATIFGYDEAGELVATEELDYTEDSVIVQYAYLVDGDWRSHLCRRTAELVECIGILGQDVLIERHEALNDAMEAIAETSEGGPVNCFLNVGAATFGCGGFAAIPFGGWAACGWLTAAATCVCFTDHC